MIRSGGLTHVELEAVDPARTLDFYAEVFGFEVVRVGDRGTLLQAPGGPGSLLLTPARPWSAVAPSRFGLRVPLRRDLDAAVQLALAHGAALVDRTDHAVGGSTVVLVDPDGHRVTL